MAETNVNTHDTRSVSNDFVDVSPFLDFNDILFHVRVLTKEILARLPFVLREFSREFGWRRKHVGGLCLGTGDFVFNT
jgi:hypothetical protein